MQIIICGVSLTPYRSRITMKAIEHVQQSVNSFSDSGSREETRMPKTMQPPSLWVQAKPKEFSKYNKLITST